MPPKPGRAPAAGGPPGVAPQAGWYDAPSRQLAGDGAGVVVDAGTDQALALEGEDEGAAAPEVPAGGLEVGPGAEVGAGHPPLAHHRVVAVVDVDDLEPEIGEVAPRHLPVPAHLVDAVVDPLVADELVARVVEARQRRRHVVGVLGVEQRAQGLLPALLELGSDRGHVGHGPPPVVALSRAGPAGPPRSCRRAAGS